MKKKILGVCALMFACVSSVLLFTGCGVSPKTFTSRDGISITLTSNFREQSIGNYSLALSTESQAFLAEKVAFGTQNTQESWTEQEYAQAVVASNSGLSTMSEVTVDAENNLVYFDYTNVSQGKTFYYFAVAKKGTDAFWLCQFSCYESQKATNVDQFKEWAETIQVS